VANYKLLGAYLNEFEDLNWNTHIDYIFKKACKRRRAGFASLSIYLFIYLHHTIIALIKELGHHNSLTPITVGPLQNINININRPIENRNN
jgi:hypothetical protein